MMNITFDSAASDDITLRRRVVHLIEELEQTKS
jgi:hypothetical protein